MKTGIFSLIIVAFLLLIFCWVFTLVNFGKLPEQIPVHFNMEGVADGFGSKFMIFFLVGIATLMFIFTFYLSKNPHSKFFNIPPNLKKDPEIGAFIASVLNIFVMLMSTILVYESIQIAMGKSQTLGSGLNWVTGLLLLFVLGIVIYSVKISRSKKPLN